MQHKFFQLLFSISLLGCCWLGMMALHELGHVLGAVIVSARIEKVVLHPLTISSTTVAPNSNPGLVVWLGPILGCLIPLLLAWSLLETRLVLANSFHFFSGFCLIANGLYIGAGSFASIGDCDELFASGTPHWAMILFGAVATTVGMTIWHRMGSIENFLRRPQPISASDSLIAAGLFAVMFFAGAFFYPV